MFPEPPEWIQQPVDIDSSPGQDIRVECRATGFPQPIVEWTSLDSGERFDKHIGEILVLRNVSYFTAGRYQCRVSNGVGKDLMKVITIRVHGRKSAS